MTSSARDPANDDTRRWHEVDGVFEAALELPAGERKRFLAERCRDDPDLLRRVRDLLAHAETAGERLDGPGEELIRAVWGDHPSSERDGVAPGSVVGRYRIVSELGRGGMATVYEAERADGVFEQRVAVKVLRRGLDTEEVVRRFVAERQILSGLEHPNIARLIDGGATADGRPYLVMERVHGKPITQWADEHRLSVRERLRLFRQITDAVQFAHRHLIIHRDLKPSNILVDDDGTVKLLDFGIAKLLQPAEGTDLEALTRTGLSPFTPAYASPEQIRGDPVTTASDVYQLGVLLYMLLCAHRPFEGKRPALDAAITGGRARRPSDAVTAGRPTSAADSAPDAAASPESIAARRATTADTLRRALRGDLDAIVLAALRPEPERRYASAGELGDDLGRFLAHEPVEVRPDTWAYRTRRFAVRHPGLVAALGVALIVATSYVVTVVRYADRLEVERDRAQLESAKAQQVSSFLMDLFRANDPDLTEGEDLSASDLLERGQERADRLASQPALHAEMLGVIGRAYTMLGRYDRAEPLFREALTDLRGLHDAPDADVAASLARLGDILQQMGQYDRADPMLLEAIETARSVGDSATEADGLTDYGYSLVAQGGYERAEASLRESLAIRRALYGDRDQRTAHTLQGLGIALEKQDRYAEAESTYTAALDIMGALDPEHTVVANTLTALARLYTAQGRLDEAEPLLRRSLELARTRLGPDHVGLALILNELGTISARRLDFAQAEQYFRESLEINEAALGPEHSEVAVGLNNLSYTLVEQGRLVEALPLRRRAFEVARAAVGDSHENTGWFAFNLGYLLDQLGELAEAEARYRQSIAILRRALPEGHLRTTVPMVALADLLIRTGRATEAEPLLRRARADRVAGEDAASAIAVVDSELGSALAVLGRRDEARSLLESGYATLEETLGPDARLTRDARARLEALGAR